MVERVICRTQEEFDNECRKYKTGKVIGQKLYYDRSVVAELRFRPGGARRNAGRPKGSRNIPLCIRLSKESMDKLNALTDNKSEFLDILIKNL